MLEMNWLRVISRTALGDDALLRLTGRRKMRVKFGTDGVESPGEPWAVV